MRIALVSPYSWSYPGGVTRHIEALAEQFIAGGHHVRVLAPLDPADRFSAVLHRGANPQAIDPPDYLVSLGRTLGFKANGAVSNLSITPYGVATMHKELRTGRYDVVHIHEPVAPLTGWVATDSIQLPLVGTFHSYSESLVSNGVANLIGARRVLNRLHVRIAVSEAAAWTGRRFFGGHYRVIPNGVHVPPSRVARISSHKLRIVFVGQSVERKGLPVLLRAFEALREHIPTELTVIGVTPAELAPLLVDCRGVHALGKVDDARKRAVLQEADVLCAPSLRGESFGMVLTEAFAAGTPVVASDIAGYRDVVRDGVDGVLVPRGDAQALAETLRDLWDEPERRLAMGVAAAEHVERFAWPRVAADVMNAYEDAIATPVPTGLLTQAAVRVGARAADLKPTIKRPPDPEPRAEAAWSAPAVRRLRPPRRDGVDLARGSGARLPGTQEDRARPHRLRADQLESGVRPARAGHHVQLDGAARGLVARDPDRGAAAGARADVGRDAGDVHRRADVLDAAGPSRRAGALADRGQTDGPPARASAGRARDDRLSDADQHRRAGRSSAR